MQERQLEQKQPDRKEPSEFLNYLKKGMLLGVALVLLLVPAVRMVDKLRAPQTAPPVATAPPAQPSPRVPGAPADGTMAPALRLADFKGEDPSPDARLVANWVVATRDNKKHGIVIVDKKDARVYVFTPDGKLKDSAPVLLGSARGDDSFPGIGDKPLSAVLPEEKTTPAGRFVAEAGRNAKNEDIVWVDYDAAVSMHRVRPLVARERRLERLASLTIDDNRISFGCINLPVTFYEEVLSPTVQKQGAIVYVLPDVKTPAQVFGAYDVTNPMHLAAAQQAARKNGAPEAVQKVALQHSR